MSCLASTTKPVLLSQASPIPPTPKRSVLHTYLGVEVVDDYEWLEDRLDPEVLAWTAEQTRHARAVIEALPRTAAIRRRWTELKRAQAADYHSLVRVGEKIFAIEYDPGRRQQSRLVRMGLDADPRYAEVVVDPNTLDPDGGVAIDFFVPSPDGSMVAVSLSRGGTESGTLHVYDASKGVALGDAIPRVNGGTAGGSAAWDEAGQGLFYTRYPAPGERPPEDLGFYQQVYHHRLGSAPSLDTYVLGRELPRIAEVQLRRGPSGRRMLIRVAHGDGGACAFFLREANGSVVRLADDTDEIAAAEIGADDAIYLLSRKGAPLGKVLRLPPDATSLDRADLILAEGPHSIRDLIVTASRLYVIRLMGGPCELVVYGLDGTALGVVPTPPISSVNQVAASAHDDDMLFRCQTFISPPAWLRLRGGVVEETPLRVESPVSFDDAEVVRETCISPDGTRVPLNIIRKKGVRLDGTMPGLLTAYGGFGVSLSPRFRLDARMWLDEGGFLAIANLRGGGEFGEAWHTAGKLTSKPNVFDDMAACARHLCERGYTRPSRLALSGGSNGGLLMGAMLTRHPDLFGAVVSSVGIYDMLRVERTPNGGFNVTEYGSVRDPDQFRVLYSYSPYHRVRDGTPYPPTLLLTGENDPRVDSWHSKKMAARMQAATPTGCVLLFARPDAGHGIGRSHQQEIDDTTLELSFLFHALGLDGPVQPRAGEVTGEDPRSLGPDAQGSSPPRP